jgi:two-component sensor histidine kinase
MQNAVDHAFPEGTRGARVGVKLGRDGDDVVIEVSDNGAGLPDSFAIERSQRLGLSIVHALVTGELGGTIEMKSDGGTSVVVTVPVVRAPRGA